MGTNYYHEVSENKPCPTCGHLEGLEATHIGKSSWGWTFTFHGTEQIRSYADWLKVLKSGGVIRDEYGDVVSLGEFARMVEAKRTAAHNHAKEYPSNSWLDDEGNSFSEGEFS